MAGAGQHRHLRAGFFTSDVKAAGAIASTEVLTKILLYYFHERVWSTIGWGAKRGDDDPATKI